MFSVDFSEIWKLRGKIALCSTYPGRKNSKICHHRGEQGETKSPFSEKSIFWRKFFEGINRFSSSSWSDWCAPGASERTLGVICSSSSSSSTNRLLFFVKLKVAIARMVENGFLVRRLWAAKNHENRSFFVSLLHAIERGSSPVYGTIFKIARFLDFEKLWLKSD